MREAVGPAARIRVDANGAFSAAEAIELLRELRAVGNRARRAAVGLAARTGGGRAATEIPIAADESVNSRKQAEKAVDAHACSLATAKLSKVGGIGAAGAIASTLPTYLSSALDGPVGIAAAAHAAQAIYRSADDPGIAHGLATQELFEESVATRECELRDGLLHLPEGDGLGVELDEQALARRRL